MVPLILHRKVLLGAFLLFLLLTSTSFTDVDLLNATATRFPAKELYNVTNNSLHFLYWQTVRISVHTECHLPLATPCSLAGYWVGSRLTSSSCCVGLHQVIFQGKLVEISSQHLSWAPVSSGEMLLANNFYNYLMPLVRFSYQDLCHL